MWGVLPLRCRVSNHYREQLGMVLQDPYLFHGSVVENIRYGMPGASLAQEIDRIGHFPPEDAEV